jgi:predicted metal-dependent phosphoesterase TrpH
VSASPASGPTDSARFIDFHAHTTASDGTASPEGLVAAAKSAGLSAVAVTDHDTLGGIAAARVAGERLGVAIVAGVELSAQLPDRELHLLGLHIDRLDVMEEQLVLFRETRRWRAEQIIEKLHALAVPVTLESVLREAGAGAIGRPHVARAMIAAGWVRDFREAFDRFLGHGRPAYVEKHRLTIPDAIALVHRSGGLAVLAHPGADGNRARLEPLVEAGLDGVEVRHPSHSAEDMLRLQALADFFDLVPSGGSDWHGALTGPRTIGNMRVPHEWLLRQQARVNARRARERVA